MNRLETTRHLGVSLGLHRMRAAMDLLGNPHRELLAVQIAGTNGKGSTAAMTEAILRYAGLRTGLYTSPHLSRFTERIRIDGREIDGDRLAALDHRVAATGVPLTYFEVATALAFLAMAEAKVEAAVLETGLGGRLDAVTVCSPVATAITSIDLDHTELLGGTLAEIAREKAGILKPGVPLMLGPLSGDADEAVRAVAGALGVPILTVGRELPRPSLPVALAGEHQRVNAALAMGLAGRVLEAAGRQLTPAIVARALEDVRWPGRLEWVAPDLLLDCAHNVQGAAALVAALPPAASRVLVTSVVRGKDAVGMMALLRPCFERVVVTTTGNPRSRPVQEMAVIAGSVWGPELVRIEADCHAAVARARQSAGPGGVVVAGSIFLVGEVRARLLNEPLDPVVGGDPM